ncbi:MAG: Crp/Fnr family transcriptional regulator [Bacteroidota bacterium]
MQALRAAMRQMIRISDEEMEHFLADCHAKTFARKSLLSEPGKVANEVFFLEKGLVRVMITDYQGVEHTTHFALEHQFIADYGSFLEKIPANYALQALEEAQVIVLPRTAIEWGYASLQDGDRMGRLIAEFYFIYLDKRIQGLYGKSPKERYDEIGQIFPNIHARVPQHMIASYIGISPVHLSRLKKQHPV